MEFVGLCLQQLLMAFKTNVLGWLLSGMRRERVLRPDGGMRNAGFQPVPKELCQGALPAAIRTKEGPSLALSQGDAQVINQHTGRCADSNTVGMHDTYASSERCTVAEDHQHAAQRPVFWLRSHHCVYG